MFESYLGYLVLPDHPPADLTLLYPGLCLEGQLEGLVGPPGVRGVLVLATMSTSYLRVSDQWVCLSAILRTVPVVLKSQSHSCSGFQTASKAALHC